MNDLTWAVILAVTNLVCVEVGLHLGRKEREVIKMKCHNEYYIPTAGSTDKAGRYEVCERELK